MQDNSGVVQEGSSDIRARGDDDGISSSGNSRLRSSYLLEPGEIGRTPNLELAATITHESGDDGCRSACTTNLKSLAPWLSWQSIEYLRGYSDR